MRRNKAIQGFYAEKDVKVIMLSLENAASGTNLIQATHVLLLDPVAGMSSWPFVLLSRIIVTCCRVQHVSLSLWLSVSLSVDG